MKQIELKIDIFVLENYPNTSIIGGVCMTNQFNCSNQNCIPRSLCCNGINDCGDNSDETQNCTCNILTSSFILIKLVLIMILPMFFNVLCNLVYFYWHNYLTFVHTIFKTTVTGGLGYTSNVIVKMVPEKHIENFCEILPATENVMEDLKECKVVIVQVCKWQIMGKPKN